MDRGVHRSLDESSPGMVTRKKPGRSTLTPGDGDPRHGTLNGYSNLRCRCEACRAANTAQNKRQRAERQARILADPSIAPHGAESTYFNYRCPCTLCKEAHRVGDARRKSARYEAVAQQARAGQ